MSKFCGMGKPGNVANTQHKKRIDWFLVVWEEIGLLLKFYWFSLVLTLLKVEADFLRL